jgi:hypothetical protein
MCWLCTAVGLGSLCSCPAGVLITPIPFPTLSPRSLLTQCLRLSDTTPCLLVDPPPTHTHTHPQTAQLPLMSQAAAPAPLCHLLTGAGGPAHHSTAQHETVWCTAYHTYGRGGGHWHHEIASGHYAQVANVAAVHLRHANMRAKHSITPMIPCS